MENNNFYRSKANTGQVILGAVILIGLFIALFWIARGIFSILSFLGPFLLIAALIINYRVVLGYGKWLVDMVKKDFFMGILYTVLSVVGFPIVSAYLLFKAYTLKKIGALTDQIHPGTVQGTAVDAEFEILEEDDPLELKTKEELKRYEELFNEDQQ